MDSSEQFHMRHSVRWKLLMTMMALIIGLLGILTYVQITAQKKFLERDLANRISFLKDILKERGKTLADNLARQAVKDIAIKNFSNTASLVKEAVFEDKKLSYAIIMDRDKIAHVDTLNPASEGEIVDNPVSNFALNQNSAEVHEYTRDGKPYVEFIVPLEIEAEQWGVLRLGYTLEMLNLEIDRSKGEMDEEKLSKENQTNIFIIIGAVIVFIESKNLTKPLTILTASAQELAKGNFDAASNMDIHSKDEFGLLAANFVKMSDNLTWTSHNQTGMI